MSHSEIYIDINHVKDLENSVRTFKQIIYF